MAFQEINNNGELKKFITVGDAVEGYFMGSHKGVTKYGDTVFLDFIDEDGNNFSIVQTSGMLADWDKLMNYKVKVEYTGDQKNAKSGRTFKDFKIYADFEDSYLPFE
jgi:hypothetical protein